MMTNRLLHFANQLADKVQETWEDSVRTDYRNQLHKADNDDLRGNLQMHLRYMQEGVYDYGRHYRVKEQEDRYQVVYDCNVTGMPKIHCVVSKETGDVARHCIKLVEEPFFQFNLYDERSRTDCMAQAHWDRDYLN
jgi:hypothetical protein